MKGCGVSWGNGCCCCHQNGQHGSNHQKRVKLMLFAIGICYMTFVFYHNVYGYSIGNSTSNILLETEDVKSVVVVDGVDNHLNVNDVDAPSSLLLSSPSKHDTNELRVSMHSGQQQEQQQQHRHHVDYDRHHYHHHNQRLQMNERAVTATPKPSTTNLNESGGQLSSTSLNDIFITVKTTKTNHDTRLALIIKTWFQLAKEQTWFFTDTANMQYQRETNDHLINTNCSMGHFRTALCCKMAVEFDTFLESGKKWFCHFDDDNYVNIPRLVELLNDYSASVDWYLGKPSIASPLEIFVDTKNSKLPLKKISFVFATGGAGFCLSRTLALKMMPVAGNGKLVTIGDNIGLPDDVTMGYIIEYLLKVPLTVVEGFHSHLEPMEILPLDTFKQQVSFSYGQIKNDRNIVQIDGFDHTIDPTRFKTLHCYLFPYVSFCSKRT